MASYLLTWNPRRFGSWNALNHIARYKRSSWSCGSRLSMEKGSRVYLLKQGIEPRGIVASGVTTGGVYPDAHWDPKRRGKANYVDVKFDTVLAEDAQSAFPAHTIKSLRGVNWRTQMSGIEVPEEIAGRLEREWKRFAKLEKTAVIERAAEAVENRLSEIRTYVRSRHAGLRAAALAQSKGVCEGCRINYWSLPDGLGRSVLQVHHKRALATSNKPRRTKLKDLAVLCANCHGMLHSAGKTPMAIEVLRRQLKKWRDA